jgi:hypothetical protein
MDYPKFTRLKQAVKSKPEEPVDPNSYVDPRNMASEKFRKEAAIRRLMGEENPDAVYTEGDAPLEDPLLAPDDFIDPSALGKAGIKVGTKGLPMAMGMVMNRKQAIQALKNSIDPLSKLVDKDKLVKEAIKASDYSSPEILQNLSKIHGSTLLEVLGKQESPKVYRDVAESLYPTVSKNVEVIERPMVKLQGQFDPNTGKVLVNKLDDDITKASVGGAHEPQHALEHILNPKAADKMTRKYQDYNNFVDVLKENPEYLKALNNKFKDVDLKKLSKEQVDYLNEIGLFNTPERFLKGTTGKHHLEYPLNLEAEQTAELYNKALKGEPLRKDVNVSDEMIKKYLKSLTNPRLNPKKK